MAKIHTSTPDIAAPQPGNEAESRSSFRAVWSAIKADAAREIKASVHAIDELQGHFATTYEHKTKVKKVEKQILGFGVTIETGERRSISWRLHGKPQLGTKQYKLASATLSTPKTKAVGFGPYLEAQVELAGSADISLKHAPTAISAANIDARLNEKARGGFQFNLLGLKAKAYIEVQNADRAGFGYNRPFNLAPEMDGISIGGEVGDHIVKLRLPVKSFLSVAPPAIAARMTASVVKHTAEAIFPSEGASEPTKDSGADKAPTSTPTPAQTVEANAHPAPTPPPSAPQPSAVKKQAPTGWQPPPKPRDHAQIVDAHPDYMVKKGDTMWDIAKARSGGKWTYLDLAKANKDRVKNPDLIYPGQILHFPKT